MTDEKINIKELIKYIDEVFKEMDGNFMCKIHGQALEQVLSILNNLPEE